MGDSGQFRELRRDLVTGRWVVIASELAREPGQFPGKHGVSTCQLCPGSPPQHELYSSGGVRVVPSKAPALRVEGSVEPATDRMNAIGAHEIVAETPDHGRRLSELTAGQLGEVFWAIRERMTDLGRDGRLRYAAVFRNEENDGAHGHWQLMALPLVPAAVENEQTRARLHRQEQGRCGVCQLLERELRDGRRVISESNDAVAWAPYASPVPFAIWIAPRHHESHFEHSLRDRLERIGEMVGRVVRKLDVALEKPRYTITLHNGVLQESGNDHSHWRLEILPDVARGVGRGFERATELGVNPTTPEEAARFLRDARDGRD
jgi:UDPglucose--hexose-1-phosphate uridylyltransferase